MTTDEKRCKYMQRFHSDKVKKRNGKPAVDCGEGFVNPMPEDVLKVQRAKNCDSLLEIPSLAWMYCAV